MASEEVAEMVLKVTDLKQFVYCPRILYFTYVLPVPHPVTHKMDFGKTEHLELDRLEKRRKLKRYGLEQGEWIFHAQFYSERLGLQGKLDLHIQHERESYPVEFKHSSKLQFNHKVQLAGYALLLEEKLGRPVRTGFLYLIPKEEIIPVQMTQDIRDYVHDTLRAIRDIHVIGDEMRQRFIEERDEKMRLVNEEIDLGPEINCQVECAYKLSALDKVCCVAFGRKRGVFILC